MPHRNWIVAIAGAIAVAQSPADASILYTVDWETNRLVTINSATLDVEVVGPLGEVFGVISDLAARDGQLFGLDQLPDGGYLVRIDTESGAILESLRLTLDGTPLTNTVESLAADEYGRLIVGFWTPSAENESYSNGIGSVNPSDGTVTLLHEFAPGIDFDGLTLRPCREGGLFSIDREPSEDTVYLRTVSLDPFSVDPLQSFSFDETFNGVGSVVWTPAGLFGLDHITKHLHRFDPASGGLLSSEPYDSDLRMGFMAYLPSVPSCNADLDCDGNIAFGDILMILSTWGGMDIPEDLDQSGVVDFGDILTVLRSWGPCQ